MKKMANNELEKKLMAFEGMWLLSKVNYIYQIKEFQQFTVDCLNTEALIFPKRLQIPLTILSRERPHKS